MSLSGTVSSSTPPVSLTAESRFMQNFRVASAVDPGATMIAVGNSNGEVELVTVGTDGSIWSFYPDPASDTGYSSAAVGLTGSIVAGGRDAQGRLVLFAAQGLQLFYVVEINQGTTRWSTPAQLTVPAPSGATGISKIVTSNMAGDLYVGVLVAATGPWPGTLNTFCYALWSTAPAALTKTNLTVSTLNVAWTGNSAQNAALTVVDTVVLELNIQTQQLTRPVIASTFDTIDVAAVTLSTGNASILAIQSDGNVYALVGGGASPLSWQQLSVGRSFKQIELAVDDNDNVQVLLLDATNVVYHLAPDASQPSGFDQVTPILPNVAQIVLATDDGGDIDLFAAGTAQGTLTHLFQQEVSGDWQAQPMEVQTGSQVEAYVSYTCDVTVFDAAGAPLGSTPVQVWASEEAFLLVNGASYTVNASNPARVTTNATGIVSIAQPTGSLAIPTLFVSVPSLMSPGESVAVVPNANTNATLQSLTGTQLMDATDAEGNPILTGTNRTQQTADAVASAVSECVSLAISALASVGTARHVHRRQRSRGVASFSGDRASLRKVHRPSVGDSHWRLSFGAEGARFERLTAQGAAAIITERRAALPKAQGIFDWLEDIGDFVTEVVNDIVEVVEVVVTTVASGIQAAIDFVIDGVEYVFETIVDTIEQALDLVETVLAQVAIVFEQIFEWLGFLFNWPDILRTHEAISWVVNQTLSFFSGGASAIQQNVDASLAAFSSSVQSWFQQAITQVGPTMSIGTYNDSNEQPDATFSDGMSNNIVYNGFVDNASGASSATGVAARLRAELADPLSSLVTALTTLATDTQSGQAYSQAVTYFTNLGGSADQVFQGLLAGLLSVAEGLVLDAITGVQTVVDTLFGLAQTLVSAMQTLLNEAWDIPFLSDLYSWITSGSTLTLLDVIALIAAVPTTIIYKVMEGAAPFPDDASVSAFQSSVTATAMLQALGFSPTNLARLPADTSDEWTGIVSTQVATLLDVLGAVATFGAGALTAVCDAFVPPSKPPEVLDQAGLVLKAAAAFCTFPPFYASASLDCSTAAGAGLWLWIYDTIGVGIDFAYTQIENLANDVVAVVNTIRGACRFGLAVPASLGESGIVWANNILTCVPPTCNFLRLTALITATEGISVVVLVVIDSLVALSTPVLGFLAIYDEFPSSEDSASGLRVLASV